MNKNRRKQIEAIRARLGTLVTEAECIKANLKDIRDAEQDYRDNMPEALGDGEKGEKADAAIDALQQVIDDLDSLIDADFDSQLDTAAE